jgi:hypothetical protein
VSCAHLPVPGDAATVTGSRSSSLTSGIRRVENPWRISMFCTKGLAGASSRASAVGAHPTTGRNVPTAVRPSPTDETRHPTLAHRSVSCRSPVKAVATLRGRHRLASRTAATTR